MKRLLQSLSWRLKSRWGPDVIEHFGVRLPVRGPTTLPKVVRKGIIKGDYERAEAHLIGLTVGPNDTVLEIGTGIGFISTLCARLARPENVYSFEANPDLKDLIERTYELNGVSPNLTMKAVTPDGEPVRFFAAENIISSSSFDRGKDAREVVVSSDRFEDLIDSINPNVLVMDVEGAEIELLAVADLGSVTSIIVELHPHIVGEGAIDMLLQDLGAKGFVLEKRDGLNALLRARPGQ